MLASTPRQRRGFTLVELLVVIAIIGTLVALLLPAVQAARESARQAECLSHMTELGKAMIEYETGKNKLPGFAQLIRRGPNAWVGGDINVDGVFQLENANVYDALEMSWATMLLPHIGQQALWDRIVDPNPDLVTLIRRIDLLVCPSDSSVMARAELPALSYSVNTGAWDRSTGSLDYPGATKQDVRDGIGDTTDNGVFMNLAIYKQTTSGPAAKPPEMSISRIRDGANSTIMLTENIHKDYDDTGAPFTWARGTEQQVGVVWVVNTNPEPVDDLSQATIADQARINQLGDVNDADSLAPNLPYLARPASQHRQGVNVVYCDGHGQFLSQDIDYIVYQQLLTSNGRECVDPAQHADNLAQGQPIYVFRSAPPLSSQDFD